MIVAEDVLLLLTDDSSGRPLVDGTRRDIAVAGAVLAELATAGRIEAGKAPGLFSSTILRVVDRTPLGDDVLDTALARVEGPGSSSATAALDRVRKGLREHLYTRLVARGILRYESGAVLGIFPTHAWPAVDSAHEEQVRRGLYDVFAVGRAPTPREASVVALLLAVDVLPKVLPWTGVPNRELKARAKVVAADDVGGAAARAAVQAVQAAMMAGVVAVTAAGASG